MSNEREIQAVSKALCWVENNACPCYSSECHADRYRQQADDLLAVLEEKGWLLCERVTDLGIPSQAKGDAS